jgi:hypothetical protein
VNDNCGRNIKENCIHLNDSKTKLEDTSIDLNFNKKLWKVFILTKMPPNIDSIFMTHESYKYEYEYSSSIIFTDNVEDRIFIDKDIFLFGNQRFKSDNELLQQGNIRAIINKAIKPLNKVDTVSESKKGNDESKEKDKKGVLHENIKNVARKAVNETINKAPQAVENEKVLDRIEAPTAPVEKIKEESKEKDRVLHENIKNVARKAVNETINKAPQAVENEKVLDRIEAPSAPVEKKKEESKEKDRVLRENIENVAMKAVNEINKATQEVENKNENKNEKEKEESNNKVLENIKKEAIKAVTEFLKKPPSNEKKKPSNNLSDSQSI